MNVDKSHLRVKAASIRFSVTVMSEVSSEKRNILLKIYSGKSLICTKNNRGPKMEP